MKKIKVPIRYQGLMEKWIEDLRDNPDLQGKNELLNAYGKYCCLGRLCVVAGIEDSVIRYENVIEEDLLGYNTDILPSVFVGESFPSNAVPFVLTSMNDGVNNSSDLFRTVFQEWELTKYHYTFTEIADFLTERIEYEQDNQTGQEA